MRGSSGFSLCLLLSCFCALCFATCSASCSQCPSSYLASFVRFDLDGLLPLATRRAKQGLLRASSPKICCSSPRRLDRISGLMWECLSSIAVVRRVEKLELPSVTLIRSCFGDSSSFLGSDFFSGAQEYRRAGYAGKEQVLLISKQRVVSTRKREGRSRAANEREGRKSKMRESRCHTDGSKEKRECRRVLRASERDRD